MSLASLAISLLDGVTAAHQALIAETSAAAPIVQGLQAIRAALAAGLDGLTEAQINATPSADEWSIAEVLEHMAEHDRAYREVARHGVEHYVEHGLEHALQLWKLRNNLTTARTNGSG
jgi:hypothetical protein